MADEATAAPGDKSAEPARTPAELSSRWQVELGLAERDNSDFIKDGKEIVDRYKSEKSSALGNRRTNAKRFNILYSNTEVLRSALYGRAAKPDVRRRFADADPVARMAAEVIERGLIYCADTYDVDKPIDAAVQDYLLPGRGVIRIDYEPVIKSRPAIDPMTAQPAMGPDGKPVMEEFIAEQKLREKYVYWEDYRQSPARNWTAVTWVGFRHTMDADDLDDLLSEKPEGSQTFAQRTDVPMDWTPDVGDKTRVADTLKKAEVWEIWDKRERQRIWIVKGCKLPLRLDVDPYGLEDFFPLAEPLVGYVSNDTSIPEPEFFAYRDQADDLDEITARISILTKALKRRGVFDGSFMELQRLSRSGDNTYTPIKDWTNLTTKGGLAKVIESEDIKPIAEVLVQLYQQRTMLVQAIFELTGIADIMRGNSDPNETLGAQQLKAQFGSTRMKRRQRAVQRWIRDTYKLKAEIIAEHFEPNVLSEMTGQQVTPELIQLLRSDKLRSYKIDVETDSTVFEDSAQQQAEITNLLKAVTEFITAWAPIVQMQPALLPLCFEMLSVAVRSFKAGRALEDVVEQTKNQLLQMAQQKMMQPPQPDPKVAAAQAKTEQIQGQTQMQREGHQMDMQGKQIDLQGKVMDHQTRQMEASAEVQTALIHAHTPHVMPPHGVPQ